MGAGVIGLVGLVGVIGLVGCRPPSPDQASASPRPAVATVEPTPALAPPAPAPHVRAHEFVDDEALTLDVVARVKTGILPKSVTVSPDGAHLWVCNFGYSGRKNVYVYDAATLEWVGVVEFEGNAVETAFAPDGSRAYVSNFSRGVIEIIDAVSYELIAETKVVGVYPKVIAADPDGVRIYVANWGSGDVAVVDTQTRKVVDRYPAGRRPRGMAVAADGTLYVNAMWDDTVHVFGPEARSEISTCGYPRHAVLEPNDPALFVTCSGDDRLRWHDPTTGRVLGEVEVGDNPRSFGLSDDGRWAAVADFDGSSVSLVDLDSGRRHTTPIPSSDRIVGLALGKGPDLRVFATSWGDNQLIELGLRAN